jgi:hypothetical protein
VLAPAPALARIRLVGGDAEGDSRLNLEVRKWVPDAATPERAWVHAFEASVLRIDARRFEVRGRDTLRRVRIRVVSSVHQRVPDLEVDLPAPREIEVALERGGSLIAQLRMEGPPAHLMHGVLRLARTDGAAPVATDGRVFPTRSAEGRHDFLWERLAPGTYRVELRLGRAERTLAAVDGLVVRAGEQTRDPRLLPLEYPHVLRSLCVRVRDRDGKPVEVVEVYATRCEILGAGGGPASGFVWPGGDQIRIVTTEDWVDLRVTVRGYRPASLERVSRDTELTLTPGPSLRIVLQGGRPTIQQGWRLLAGMRAERGREPGLGGSFEHVSPFDDTGSLTWPMSSGGDVYVELGLSSGSAWRKITSTSITVPDDAEEHRHEFVIPAAQLRAALEGPGR